MKVPGKAKYRGDVTSYFDEAPRLMGPRTFDRKMLRSDTWKYDSDTDTTIVTFRIVDASG